MNKHKRKNYFIEAVCLLGGESLCGTACSWKKSTSKANSHSEHTRTWGGPIPLLFQNLNLTWIHSSPIWNIRSRTVTCLGCYWYATKVLKLMKIVRRNSTAWRLKEGDGKVNRRSEMMTLKPEAEVECSSGTWIRKRGKGSSVCEFKAC